MNAFDKGFHHLEWQFNPRCAVITVDFQVSLFIIVFFKLGMLKEKKKKRYSRFQGHYINEIFIYMQKSKGVQTMYITKL